MGTTSFFPSKNLGCLGDGGALLTRDAARAALLHATRQPRPEPEISPPAHRPQLAPRHAASRPAAREAAPPARRPGRPPGRGRPLRRGAGRRARPAPAGPRPAQQPRLSPVHYHGGRGGSARCVASASDSARRSDAGILPPAGAAAAGVCVSGLPNGRFPGGRAAVRAGAVAARASGADEGAGGVCGGDYSTVFRTEFTELHGVKLP
ncbi:MAG: DegT/DnrJ/EryC1/StrS family aminotransferase [Hymenobacter sp.]